MKTLHTRGHSVTLAAMTIACKRPFPRFAPLPVRAAVTGALLGAGLCVSVATAQDLPAAACLDHPYQDAASPEQEELRALFAEFSAILPDLPRMRDAIDTLRPRLCIDNRAITVRGYLDAEIRLVALRAGLERDAKLLVLIHELRHLEQLSRGFCPSNQISMQENARASLAYEADAMAVTALIAWDLAARGDGGPWQVLSEWQNYADIAERFAEVRRETGDPGSAVTAAFDQWYASDWRTESYYRASCSDYLDRLDQSHALPRYDLLPDDFWEQLCRLPTGVGYACKGDFPTGSQ